MDSGGSDRPIAKERVSELDFFSLEDDTLPVTSNKYFIKSPL